MYTLPLPNPSRIKSHGKHGCKCLGMLLQLDRKLSERKGPSSQCSRITQKQTWMFCLALCMLYTLFIAIHTASPTHPQSMDFWRSSKKYPPLLTLSLLNSNRDTIPASPFLTQTALGRRTPAEFGGISAEKRPLWPCRAFRL